MKSNQRGAYASNNFKKRGRSQGCSLRSLCKSDSHLAIIEHGVVTTHEYISQDPALHRRKVRIKAGFIVYKARQTSSSVD